MVISKSLLLGGVMVLGDFNAHLGRMGVRGGLGARTCKGFLLKT